MWMRTAPFGAPRTCVLLTLIRERCNIVSMEIVMLKCIYMRIKISYSTMATIITGDPNNPTEHFLSTNWLSAGSPESVEIRYFNNIDDSIWYSTDVIENVVFGIGVNALVGHPFYNCPDLVSVHIGPSVTTIDQGFAVSCKSLTTITVDPANPYFHIDDQGILYKKASGNDLYTMLQYPFGIGRTLSIPFGVKHIAPYFAYGHTSSDSLDTVIFFNDSSVETIGAYAFANNDFISVVIPGSISSIASTAFHRCYALATVFILQITADILSASGASVIVPSIATFRGTTHNVSIELNYVPTCFPPGTPILTDVGEVPIERLSCKHSIRGNPVVRVTRSSGHRFVINIPKGALCKNVPNRDTVCSLEHKVFYAGVFHKARDLLLFREKVVRVFHDGSVLYNVLLAKPGVMLVSSLLCETLSPCSLRWCVGGVGGVGRSQR